MLATVTLYQDTGYMPGGHHVCRRGSAPTDAGTSRTVSNVKISFAQINTADLPIPYIDMIGYTYIKIETDDKILYGWIMDIVMAASRSEVSRIYWQWDHWRTWGQTAVLGSGRITRSRSLHIDRPDNIMRGYFQKPILFSKITDMLDDVYNIDQQNVIYRSTNWIVMQYIAKPNQTITEIRTICWPCTYSTHMADQNAQSVSDTAQGPRRDQAYSGLIEELIGIDPENILGAWITPVCPFPSAFTFTQIEYGWVWKPISIAVAQLTKVGDYGYFRMMNAEGVSIPGSNSITLRDGHYRDTVNNTVCITDFVGNIVWALPYGISLRPTGQVGFSFSPLSGQMVIHFRDVNAASNTYIQDAAEGLSVTIPLPTLPISSNSWQSYVLSGQRDYEIESAKAANEAAYVKGLTNSGMGALEGALAGSLAAPGIGTAIGAGIGLVTSLVGSTINQQTEESLREKVQGLRDTAVANQAQTMIVPGQSSFWIQSGEGPHIVIMQSHDNGEYFAHIDQYGYNTDYAMQTCDILIDTDILVGPIQIEKLDVTGPIPTAARLQIRDMFAKGVYID